MSSLLAIVYVWRVVEVLYLSAPASGTTAIDPPLMMTVPMIILAAACVYFGIFTDLTLGTAFGASEALLSGNPGLAEPSSATSALPIGKGGH